MHTMDATSAAIHALRDLERVADLLQGRMPDVIECIVYQAQLRGSELEKMRLLPCTVVSVSSGVVLTRQHQPPQMARNSSGLEFHREAVRLEAGFAQARTLVERYLKGNAVLKAVLNKRLDEMCTTMAQPVGKAWLAHFTDPTTAHRLDGARDAVQVMQLASVVMCQQPDVIIPVCWLQALAFVSHTGLCWSSGPELEILSDGSGSQVKAGAHSLLHLIAIITCS